MHSFPSWAVGSLTLLLFALNTIWWGSLILLLAFIKFIVPHAGLKRRIYRLLVRMVMVWIDGDSSIIGITRKIEWDVQGLEYLDAGKSCLVISNHRSWADIFVLVHILKYRVPFFRFFLKQQLIWVPIIGIACWALDFPFLKRYPRSVLQKHPELRGKDMETTRRHCERYKTEPVAIVNFAEGTRFTFGKHQRQKSPYRHLLVPKAGGAALVFSTLGDYLNQVVDITIVYPRNPPPVHFWDLLAGRVPCITVRVEVLPVPENVAGMNYEDDHSFRERMQQWINSLWRAKDERIEAVLAGNETCGSTGGNR